eukprot:TRINITY_DN4962_c0_g1_i4.p2 TRINITY_DN4962_c0_g1~~TRINITY_DN4962_c0_g1_i4.p2  ORF type:complete len:441 (+),score=158.48 TRINITY_DN4962_c0_g1_i4:78-1325(+)
MAAPPPPPPPAEGGGSAPQTNAEALQQNDDVVDMLMLLDYENRFCDKEFLPISRIFFVYPGNNTAAQFKYFSRLVAWLLELIQRRADWDEYDDPNTVTNNILTCLKDIGLQLNVAPGKVKQGYGDAVCLTLHTLLKDVLRRVSFEFGAPVYPDEGLADEAEVDSDAEIHSECDEDINGDGEDEDLMYQEDEVKKTENDSDEENHQVLEANIDPKEWLLEVERVAPRLKIQIGNDAKEWRTHLQQTRAYKQVIDSQFPTAQGQLDALSRDLSQAMERIKSKEAFINSQFEQRAGDYRQQQEELQTVQSQYTELNEVVMNLQIELKNVVEELDVVKAEMEERSTTVTDTAPIVKMKDSFKKLRQDTRQLEVRIGVVSHTLMQAKLRQRPQDDRHKKGAYKGAAGAGGSDVDASDDGD